MQEKANWASPAFADIFNPPVKSFSNASELNLTTKLCLGIRRQKSSMYSNTFDLICLGRSIDASFGLLFFKLLKSQLTKRSVPKVPERLMRDMRTLSLHQRLKPSLLSWANSTSRRNTFNQEGYWRQHQIVQTADESLQTLSSRLSEAMSMT